MIWTHEELPWPSGLTSNQKKQIEELSDLRDHVSAIHAEVRAGEDGQDEIEVLIDLLPSFPISDPSVETGLILNRIASTVRQRAAELPVSTVISFSKEGEE